jgi:hypothetical protein
MRTQRDDTRGHDPFTLIAKTGGGGNDMSRQRLGGDGNDVHDNNSG